MAQSTWEASEEKIAHNEINVIKNAFAWSHNLVE